MSNHIGNIYTTNSSGELEITKYINNRNVEVRFIKTGYVTKTQMVQIRNGQVKDLLIPSVFGVGFLGAGEYVAKVKGKQTKAYMAWNNMLSRCYSEAAQKRRPTYQGCAVHPDWHNFQTFAKWYHENYPADGKTYQLDKDILVDGNRVYGPETCLFVSQAENTVKARAKTYVFLDPDGNKVKIYNLTEFCRGNSLDQGIMSAVNLGKVNSHKGWTKPVSH